MNTAVKSKSVKTLSFWDIEREPYTIREDALILKFNQWMMLHGQHFLKEAGKITSIDKFITGRDGLNSTCSVTEFEKISELLKLSYQYFITKMEKVIHVSIAEFINNNGKLITDRELFSPAGEFVGYYVEEKDGVLLARNGSVKSFTVSKVFHTVKIPVIPVYK